MSKINPFDNNHFIGYISFVSPQFAKVHFPSSTLLNKTIFQVKNLMEVLLEIL